MVHICHPLSFSLLQPTRSEGTPVPDRGWQRGVWSAVPTVGGRNEEHSVHTDTVPAPAAAAGLSESAGQRRAQRADWGLLCHVSTQRGSGIKYTSRKHICNRWLPSHLPFITWLYLVLFSPLKASVQFDVRPDICVSGTSPESVSRLLSELAQYGTHYLRLSRFSLSSASQKGLVFQVMHPVL